MQGVEGICFGFEGEEAEDKKMEVMIVWLVMKE